MPSPRNGTLLQFRALLRYHASRDGARHTHTQSNALPIKLPRDRLHRTHAQLRELLRARDDCESSAIRMCVPIRRCVRQLIFPSAINQLTVRHHLTNRDASHGTWCFSCESAAAEFFGAVTPFSRECRQVAQADFHCLASIDRAEIVPTRRVLREQ